MTYFSYAIKYNRISGHLSLEFNLIMGLPNFLVKL